MAKSTFKPLSVIKKDTIKAIMAQNSFKKVSSLSGFAEVIENRANLIPTLMTETISFKKLFT